MIRNYLLAFDGDSILASQWSRVSSFTSEQKLCLAILEDAVKEYFTYAHMTHRRARHRTQACEDWFFSEDTEWPFSFINVCHYLHIDPQYFRRGLEKKIESLSAPMALNFRRITGRRVSSIGENGR